MRTLALARELGASGALAGPLGSVQRGDPSGAVTTLSDWKPSNQPGGERLAVVVDRVPHRVGGDVGRLGVVEPGVTERIWELGERSGKLRLVTTAIYHRNGALTYLLTGSHSAARLIDVRGLAPDGGTAVVALEQVRDQRGRFNAAVQSAHIAPDEKPGMGNIWDPTYRPRDQKRWSPARRGLVLKPGG